MLFDIVLNQNGFFGNYPYGFVAVYEKTDSVINESETLYELMTEVPVNDIVDAKKVINDFKKYSSIDEIMAEECEGE